MVAKNHFDDCPYYCNVQGKILDVDLRAMVDCPHCSEKKKELLRKGYVETESDEVVPLSTVLGIENEYLSTKFVYESVIPEGELLFIEEDSVEWQKSVAEELYNNLITGTKPNESYCFGISIKGCPDRFAYPMLAKAYLSGFSISKFITCSDFSRLQLRSDTSVEAFYESDILFMLINDGVTLGDVSSAKGLMQSRGLRGLPTIFLTTWTIEACSGLLGFNSSPSYLMAKPVFVSYKKSKKEGHSSYINGLLGVQNTRLENNANSVSMIDLLD